MKSLHSALINIRRSPYQSIVVILMITITFFVAYNFSLLMLGSHELLKFFEKKPQVIAFFKIDTADAIIEEVKNSFQNKIYVDQVVVVSKTEALKIYQESKKDNPLLLELVTADILPASIEVSSKDIKDLVKIKEELELIPEIDDVELQEDVINQLENWTNAIRIVGGVFALILAFTSFMLMVIIISLKAATKKRAISIMRVIGASKAYIIKPFIIEGMLYGIIGSLFAWLITIGCFIYATPFLSQFFKNIISFPLDFNLFLLQLGIGTSLAILFGSMASIVAVSKLIKK